MKAVFLKGPRKMIVKDVDDPKPKPDEVIVKVKYCGICGSDLHAYANGIYSGIMGHEFTGDIESTGQSVKGWKIGDRVTVNPILACGSCFYCKKGDMNLCLKIIDIGVTAPGGFAERVAVPVSSLHELGEVSYELGTMIESLSAPLRAVKYSVRPGDTVMILGAGPIGLLVIPASRVKGAKRVYVSEPSQVRRETARKLGADEVFNPNEVRVTQKIRELTQGLGADVAFECAGIPATIQAALNIVRKGGKVMVVGLFTVDAPTNFLAVATQEIEIKGIINYTPEDFGEAARLIKGNQIDLGKIPIAKIGLSEIVDKGFEALLKPEKNYVRILVDPQR